jgi:hypothetical protein
MADKTLNHERTLVNMRAILRTRQETLDALATKLRGAIDAGFNEDAAKLLKYMQQQINGMKHDETIETWS